ncbi:MAG: hypothetical protein Q4C89_12590 [Deinococcus sp.]|uniref:hypothetical protein n=1 Tax=Deinococcus sp. TaxID=47478 RepID=UPI0026DA9E6C|nr:hypothetical protein [Deinococcus sp.]MDO4246854.1 hypothetical protein [Deinococcus sp.]
MPRTKRQSDPMLPRLLEEMFTASAERRAAVHRKLMSGLHVKVALRGEKRQVILWRDGERLPSRKECEVIARDAGFQNPKYQTWKCKEADEAFLLTEGPQILTPLVPVLAPAAAPVAVREAREGSELRGEVCGLCRHGQRDEYGLIACTLGWEAHDGLWSEIKKTWAVMGHPGVPVPLLSPQCRCMAVGGRWVPRTVAA